MRNNKSAHSHYYSVIILIVALLGISISRFFIISTQAATLTSSKVTISDSRPSVTAGHTFVFTTATTGTIATIVIQYCTTASGVCTKPTGLTTTGAGQGSITGVGAGTTTFTADGTFTYTVAAPASINSGVTITMPYTAITNPSVADTSSYVRIITNASGPTEIDSTTVAFGVLTATSVAMTATVDSTFSFSIAAVNTAGTVNSATTNITTTANTVPFGTLSGTSKIGALDTSVTTNSSLGYTITIASLANPPMSDALSDNIDSFTGTNATPTVWSDPNGTSPSVNTGFLGYTTEDTSLSGSGSRFSSNKWAGLTATPEEVAHNTTGGAARVKRIGLQADVNSLQPFGSYTGTVLLVATPTY